MTNATRRAFRRATGAATVFGAATPAAANPDEAEVPRSGSGTGRITNLVPTPIREVSGNRFEDRVLTGTVSQEGADLTYEIQYVCE